jgi:hypothetical protein
MASSSFSEKRARDQQAEFQHLAAASMNTLTNSETNSEAPKRPKIEKIEKEEDEEDEDVQAIKHEDHDDRDEHEELGYETRYCEDAAEDVVKHEAFQAIKHEDHYDSDEYDELGPPAPPVEPPREPSEATEESAEEVQPSSSSAACPRPSRAPHLAQDAQDVDEMLWYHRSQAPPLSEPLRRSSAPWDEPAVRQCDIHRNRYTASEIADLRAESLVSTLVGSRWQDRGPPRLEEDPNQTWRGQRYRDTGNGGFGRWGNRGGKFARWWAGYYHAKGNGKGALQTFLAANPKPQKDAT